ncbi:MAG TPA: flagellar basal-body rod protein FlgG [Ectothiorhodospiraceae bacterium]|nr:flagellar basal-body rod protein FlgG [Ectothiorhodospiraceae bacterium]
MNPALWIAKTGVEAQQTRMSVISNNLANVSTNGFKRDRAVFEDLLYQTQRQPGAQSSQDSTLPSGLMVGTGVRTVATEKLHTQGSLVQTGNALDLAVQGRGFFQILQPDGSIGYTRDGAFQLDAEGQVVTSNGYLLQPGITLPADAQSISIGIDGTVSYTQQANATPTVAGNIDLADFVNPTGLQPIGGNLYVETAASGAPQVGAGGQNGLGTIMQSAVEGSNVNVVGELVDMIETQRAYEMNSKAISAADQMLQYINQQL